MNKLAERPEKKVKMERLSKLFGFDFIITLRAIDPERYADIQKMAVDFTNGSADNIDIYQMQTQTLLAGIADLTAQITELNGYTTQEKADKAVKN